MKKVYFILGLVIVVAVCAASLSSKMSPPNSVPNLDKFIHFWGYALIACGALIMPSTGRGRVLLLSILLLGAGGTELIQHFSPERTVSVWDFIANVTGVALGGLVGVLLSWAYRNRKKSKQLYLSIIEYLRRL